MSTEEIAKSNLSHADRLAAYRAAFGDTFTERDMCDLEDQFDYTDPRVIEMDMRDMESLDYGDDE